MALIVEDGTGKVDANSYVSVDDAMAYASARGVTLPTDPSAVESLIVKSMDYIEAQRARFQGEKTYPDHPQALQWPRACVEIDDYPFPEDAIPKELVAATCQCVMEIFAGGDLTPSTPAAGTMVKREKVDVLETEYMTAADLGSTGFGPWFPKVENLLQPLYNVGGLLRSVRV
jgi:hypothetical protein